MTLLSISLGLLIAFNPVLGLAAFLSLGFAVGFLQSGSFAVSTFLLTTYFEALGGDGALSPIKVAGGGLVVAGALALALHRRDRSARVAGVSSSELADIGWMRHPVIVGAMVGFVIIGGLSIGWAVDHQQVKTLTQRLATDALVFAAVGIFIRRPAQLRRIFWIAIAGATLSTLYGLVTGAQIFDRFIGAMFDPNEYAATVVPSIALGYAAIESTRSWIAKVLGLVACGVCTWGIIGSESRGGLLALGVLAVVIVATSRGRERARFIALAAALAAVASLALLVTPQGELFVKKLTNGDSSGRSDLWHVAGNMIKRHPITGVGLGNYPVVSVRYLDAQVIHAELFVSAPRVVHNTPLEIFAELGIFGFTSFYTFVGGCIFVLGRALRRARRLANPLLVPLGRGVLAAQLSALATGLFLSGEYQELTWIMLGLGLAYVAMVEQAERATRSH